MRRLSKLRRATTKEVALEQVAKVKKAFASPLLPSAFQQLHAETGVERARKRQHLGNKAWFNLLIGVMLCVNTIVIGIETDYSRGRKLEDRLVFFIIETLFAVTFFSEVIVRMHHHGWEYAIDPWNIFDYCLVVFGWTDVLVSVTDTGSGGLRLASSLRLFRLLRVVRSIRGIKVLAGLWVVIQGLLDSYRTVLWVAFAMWIFIFCFGAALCVLGGQDRFAFEYWYMGHKYVGSVLRAMLTMLQVATFDRWAETVARPLFHVDAIVSSLGSDLTTLNLSVDAIVSSLGSDLTTLNLSANSFDGHGLESVLSFIRRAPKLTDINLSGNKLSDSSVSRLCLQLSQHCQHLRRLSLSDVMIGWDGETAGASLGSLVTVLKMKNLDVSFNALHGQGAVEFLKSLPSSRLSCLDMSWNCLGKGAQSRSVAEEMSQVFQRCGSLQHLDVSYNSFQSQELEILAKGLAANRTLWGLHIDGSGAVVDADAFLIPPAEFKPESNDPRAQSGRRKKSKSKTARKQSKAPKKEAEAEISVAGTLLSPQELEVRMQALQGQMELQDLIQEYHQRVDQEEKDQMETARRQTTNLALMDAAEIERMPVSMPELIRRLKPCQKMSPRSQDEMLQSLTSEVRPELPALLRQQGDRPSLLYFQGTKENFLYKHSNCWICGDWVEVLLEAGPQDLPWPSDEKCREKGMAVCALVSIDNFSRPIALHANWDGIWRGSRFLPPTERCFVVFQMGEELITVHQGLPVRSLQRPMAMPLWRQSPQVGAAVGSCTEVNVLRIGALAEAFCNGTEPACRGARVKCTAAQASFAQRGKVSEAHPRCPVAWTKAANI